MVTFDCPGIDHGCNRLGALALTAALVVAGASSCTDGAESPRACGDKVVDVCIAPVGDVDSDAVIAADSIDGAEPIELSNGACIRSATDAGPWSLCVVPVANGQAVVGRDSGDKLIVRVGVGTATLEFPVQNRSGEATLLQDTFADAFQVVDQSGSTLGTLSGVALVESAQSPAG